MLFSVFRGLILVEKGSLVPRKQGQKIHTTQEIDTENAAVVDSLPDVTCRKRVNISVISDVSGSSTNVNLFTKFQTSILCQTFWRGFFPKIHGEFNGKKKKSSPKQWKSRSRNFIVWNSEIIGFHFTEKSLSFTQKHKRNIFYLTM